MSDDIEDRVVQLAEFRRQSEPRPRPAAPAWGPEHLTVVRGAGQPWGGAHGTTARVAAPWGDAAEGALCQRCEGDHGEVFTSSGAMPCPVCAPIRRLLRRLRWSGIDWRYADVERTTRWGEWPEYVSPAKVAQLAATDHGLLLAGTTRTGKTHLAALVAWAALWAGRDAMWVKWSRFLDKLRDSYRGPEPLPLPWGEATGLVVVDDVGVGAPTEWGTTQLYTMLEEIAPEATLVVTTNLSVPGPDARKPTVADWLGARCWARIEERCGHLTLSRRPIGGGSR